MTNINPTDYHEPNGSYALYTWAEVTDEDEAQPAFVEHNASEMIIQNSGEHGGSTMTVSGSLDNGYYTPNLVDPKHELVSIAEATPQGRALRDNWLYVKPVLVGGDGSQSLTILLLVRLR